MTREERRYCRVKDTLDEFYPDLQQEGQEEAVIQLLADLYFFIAQNKLDKEHIKDVAELEALP